MSSPARRLTTEILRCWYAVPQLVNRPLAAAARRPDGRRAVRPACRPGAGSDPMVGVMGAPRSRTPNEPGARDIAEALYPDLGSVDWIPSDDADVFRLSFSSGREPRILKMATHGIRAVWREIGAFPAMRRLGIPEVLEFEHTSDDLPDQGIDFHVTVELVHPQQASRAMADLWTSDRARALDVAHWLGDCTGRIESLDWPRVPRANSPEQSVAIGT